MFWFNKGYKLATEIVLNKIKEKDFDSIRKAYRNFSVCYRIESNKTSIIITANWLTITYDVGGLTDNIKLPKRDIRLLKKHCKKAHKEYIMTKLKAEQTDAEKRLVKNMGKS